MLSMMKQTVVCMMLLPLFFVELSGAMEERQVTAAVLPEDYDLYDQIIEGKFLTSQIQLVLLERMTVSRLMPNQPDSLTLSFFQQQEFFNGMVPHELAHDFIGANQIPSRLERQFQFGVRYRFVSGETSEDVEAHLAVSAVSDHRVSLQSLSVLDRLAFSRVGRTLKNDQALVYVENRRRDGTGAGFLVWFHRWEQLWQILDTEVVWTIRGKEDGDES